MATKKPAKAESTIVGRQELTKHIATQAQLTQKKAAEVLESTLDHIRDSLKAGHEVRLVGFGSVKARRSAAPNRRNPRHRKTLNVPTQNRMHLLPGPPRSGPRVNIDKLAIPP